MSEHTCSDCGVEMDEGEGKTFTVCGDCFDKHYEKYKKPSELDTLKAENKRLKEALDKLNDYRQCVNKIEDFFEYRYRSYSPERVKKQIDEYIIELSKGFIQTKDTP